MRFFLLFIWFFCIFIGMLFPSGYFAAMLAVATFFLLGTLVLERSNVHMMFFLGYCTFIFLPALVNWVFLEINFSLFFLTSVVVGVFLYATRRVVVKEFLDYGSFVRLLFLILCFSMIVLFFIGVEVRSFFPFLILILSLSFRQGSTFLNSTLFACFLTVFLTYVFFKWNGFGRVVIMGWLILAALQFSYSINFKVNKYIFGLTPAFGASLLSARDLLQLKFSGLEAALYDSAYGPYRRASSFIDRFDHQGYDVLGFLDQIMFTLFVFVPREIWPDKPYGFGFEYTLRHLGASKIDSGHTIASTLIGDHIYYLGYLGFFTSLLVFLVIALLVNVLYKIKGINGNGVVIFSASMMVLAWGGMTSFSARVALAAIVFFLFLILFRPFLVRKTNIVWGG